MTAMPTIQTPEDFLSECRKRGIKLAALNGSIKATGRPPANPEKFAAFLKSKKPELLALLSGGPLGGNPERSPISERDPMKVTPPHEAPPKRLPISEFSEYPGPLTPPPFVGRGALATDEEQEDFCAWAKREAELMTRKGAPVAGFGEI